MASMKDLTFRLVGKDDSASSSLDKLSRKASSFGTQFKATFAALGADRLLSAGLDAIGAGFQHLTGYVRDSFDTANQWQALNAQTAAVLKSTGNAANVTGKQIWDLSQTLEAKTSTEAESIQSGANLLLTFKNIRNEAGAGNDVFNRTTAIAVDMSRALGKDVTGSAKILGKALNDPIKGMSALSRVGVTFTDQQKQQIAAMVKAGDVMGAQKLILDKLNQSFGGSGAAYRKTFAGQMYQVKDAVGDMGATAAGIAVPALQAFGGGLATIASKVAGAVMPQLERLGPLVKTVADRFSVSMQPSVEKVAGKLADFASRGLGKVVTLFEELKRATSGGFTFGNAAAAIEKVFPGFQNLTNVFRLLTPLAPIVGRALADLGPQIGKILPSLARAALSLLPALEKVIVALLPVIPPLARVIVALAPVIEKVADAAVWLIDHGLKPTVNMLSVASRLFTGATTPARALGEALSGKLGPAMKFAADTGLKVGTALGAFVRALQNVTGGVTRAWTAITGAFSRGLQQVTGAVTRGWTQISGGFTRGWSTVTGGVTRAWSTITGGFTRGLSQVTGATSRGWSQITGAFSRAWSTVTGGVSRSWSQITGAFSRAWATLTGGTSRGWSSISGGFSRGWSAVTGGVSRAWSSITAAFSRGWSAVTSGVTRAWGQITSAVSRGIGTVVSDVGRLPGRVVSALGNLGSLLFSSGRALINGFASGIRDAIGGAISAAKSVVSAVSRYFPFSPAKEGPLSGRGYTTYSGQALTRDFAKGMNSNVGVVRAAGLNVAAAAAFMPGSPTIGVASRGAAPAAPAALAGVQPWQAKAGSGPLVAIENFHAHGQSPDDVAAALAWQLHLPY